MVQGFVDWYNHQHLHSGIRYSGIRFLTPAGILAPCPQVDLMPFGEDFSASSFVAVVGWAGATRNWKPVEVVYLNPEKLGKDETIRKEIAA